MSSTRELDHDTSVCTDLPCAALRQELGLMRRLLLPALQPGGSTVDALMYVIDQARQVQRTRDAYRSALTRVTQVYNLGEVHGGIVHTTDLCRAMFVQEDER